MRRQREVYCILWHFIDRGFAESFGSLRSFLSQFVSVSRFETIYWEHKKLISESVTQVKEENSHANLLLFKRISEQELDRRSSHEWSREN
jgi:hypothetical protein